MVDLLTNKRWRLNNLYRIIDKQGKIETFRFNWAQEELFAKLHTCNIVLKARQLGISTFCCLYILDECLFKANTQAGIIAHTREDAEYLFKRIKFAYDNLPAVETSEGILNLREIFKAKNDSARELTFVNNSMIRVGTSMRSSTLNILHLSEFGKICAQFPSKAEEIITGSLNTVAVGQQVFIESTAEGTSGYFKDMCDLAEEKTNAKKILSEAEYRFHFFPWFKHPEYQLKESVWYPPKMLEYFEQLKGKGINLTEYQKAWYTQKYNIQKDGMLREFPSTSQEAFQASTESQYYARYINQARDEKRIGIFPYDSNALVHTAWDLGYFDAMSVWYFQVTPSGDLRIIDFHETSGQSLSENIQILKSKSYIYGEHFVPHDAKVHEMSSGLTRLEIAYDLGINMTVIDRLAVQDGIDLVKSILPRCWFHEPNTKVGIDHLMNYCREWNAALGRPEERPRHDEHSHACFIAGTQIETIEGKKPIEKLTTKDKVLTPTGYHNVLALHAYKAKDLIEITINNTTITCTPNHKIFTTRGLIYADDLRYDDIIFEQDFVWENILFIKTLGLGFRDYFSLVTMIKSSSLMEENISGMGVITKLVDGVKNVSIYIEQYGNILMEESQTATTFITLMKTLETMISPIYNCLRSLNTCHCTLEKNRILLDLENQLRLLLLLLQNGIEAKKALNGIDNMPSNANLGTITENLEIAINATKNMSLEQLLDVFAQTIAKVNLEELAVLIMKLVNVQCVKNHLQQITTLKKRHVHKIARIKAHQLQNVYDITVENDHCYYANGLLVSNSDGIRYLAIAYKKYLEPVQRRQDTTPKLSPIFDTQNFPLGQNYI